MIKNRLTKNSCMVIAEIAQAHEGSLGIAHSYIDSVADAGADAVKFQMHIADEESSHYDKFRISSKYCQDLSRYDYWKRMEFSYSEWKDLKQHAEELGLLFLCSPFSVKAVDILTKLDIKAWKIASGEAANFFMLDNICDSHKPILLSTGMSNINEIEIITKYIQSRSSGNLILMQCTSQYPCPPELVGLNVLQDYKRDFNLDVGLSDHSGTIYPSLAAATLGANAVEVHVTYDKKIFGFDSSSSITIAELHKLVDGIRFIESMLHNPVNKNIKNNEVFKMEKLFKKGIFLRKMIKKGSAISLEDLKFLKPLTGIPADCYLEILGKRVNKDLSKGAVLNWDDVYKDA